MTTTLTHPFPSLYPVAQEAQLIRMRALVALKRPATDEEKAAAATGNAIPSMAIIRDGEALYEYCLRVKFYAVVVPHIKEKAIKEAQSYYAACAYGATAGRVVRYKIFECDKCGHRFTTKYCLTQHKCSKNSRTISGSND